MEKSKKLEEIKHEDFRYLPDYIVKEKSIEKVRLAYRIRSKMVNDIKSNFKNSHKGGLQCDWCESGAEESQGHAKECDGWEEERRGLNMDTMEDIIIFFKRILKRKSDKRNEGLI